MRAVLYGISAPTTVKSDSNEQRAHGRELERLLGPAAYIGRGKVDLTFMTVTRESVCFLVVLPFITTNYVLYELRLTTYNLQL